MRRAFLGILIALFSHEAVAEPVRVSAGEHSDFTRVLFEFEDRPIWNMQRRGAGYLVNFSIASVLTFDLSRVFRVIDRSRIGDIRAVGDNAVEIDVTCNCHMRIFETGDAAVVVEVHNVDSETPMAQIDLPGPGSSALQDRSAVVPKEDNSSIPRVSIGLFPTLPGRSNFLPELQSTFPNPSVGAELVTDRSLAVELVGRALSRAASQGLVSANEDLEPADRNAPSRSDLVLLSERGNLSVTTGFDRETRPDERSVSPTEQGAICLADESIDVRVWGDSQDNKMLGRLRSATISEDGNVDPKGALALARYYIHLGFGAEARGAVAFLEPSLEREVIEALAEVLDRGSSRSSVLEGQEACDSPAALWATLAQPLSHDEIPSSTNAMLAAFSALPPHLRSHLGPLLSERLHAVGLPEQARTALNAVTRGGTRTDESDLATARLELDGTDGEGARDTLAELSNGTNITAAGALLELLLDAENRGMAPNPSWVTDAPTLVGALEGNDIANDLNLAGLRGLIALDRFGDFRSALVEATPGLTSVTRRELALLALMRASDTAGDTEFLASEIGLSVLVSPEDLDRKSRIRIAARLNEIGLASRAQKYVVGIPETLNDLSVSVQTFVESGRIDEALLLARSSELNGSNELLARTLVAAGQDQAALVEFAATGEQNAAVAAALRTGNWPWIANNGADELAAASRRLSSQTEEPNAVTEAPNGALIESVRARSEHVRTLLNATAPGGDAFTN